MDKINVQDKTVTTQVVVKSIEIDKNVQVKLGESATFMIRQLDENGNLISVDRVQMNGADYSSWGNDDDYVVNFVLSKLGLNKQ